jgi:hypothetical protein
MGARRLHPDRRLCAMSGSRHCRLVKLGAGCEIRRACRVRLGVVSKGDSMNRKRLIHFLPMLGLACTPALAVSKYTPIDEGYRAEFRNCDLRNVFRGHAVTGSHRCHSTNSKGKDTSDRNNVTLLARQVDGGVIWKSKLSLDVDGSWAAWNNIGNRTTQKFTSLKWHDVANHKSQAAQVDPDQIPFIVIPTDGLKELYGAVEAKRLGREFRDKTKLDFGDLGIVIYGRTWVPAIIADGGPFNKLGEGSSKLFELIGEDRCRAWLSDRKHCVGDRRSDPYRDSSARHSATYIFYPGSAKPTMTAANAVKLMCDWARKKLKKTGSPACR